MTTHLTPVDQPTAAHMPFMHCVWHTLTNKGALTLNELRAEYHTVPPARVRAALYNLITRNAAASNGAAPGGRVTYSAIGDPPVVKPPAFGNAPHTHARPPTKPRAPKRAPTDTTHGPYAFALPREIHVMHTPTLQPSAEHTSHIDPARLEAFKRPSRVGDRLHWPDGRVTDLKGENLCR
jgi:hypothetical protein